MSAQNDGLKQLTDGRTDGQRLALTGLLSEPKTIWVLRESVLMVIETVNDIKMIKISRSLSHSLIPGILAQLRAQQSIAGHSSTLLCS